MPRTSHRAAAPVALDDPSLCPVLAALATLPMQEFLAFIRLFELWQTWPRDRRAMLAKTICPELREKDVAILAGIGPRQLYRLEAYRAFKPRLSDFKTSRPRRDCSKRRRGFSNPNDPFG